MKLQVEITSKQTCVQIEYYGANQNLPGILGVTEFVFFTQLARMATRHKIEPKRIYVPELPRQLDALEEYFGCPLIQSKNLSMSFDAVDARMPFLTANMAMWNFFEGNLKQRLKDLDASASTVERVKALLLETLPAGESSVEFIADRLAMSKRTLQRKLTAEAETYQSVLHSVRSELADHYLNNSNLSLGEISFMLGFQEPNSFIRAYSHWHGVSPGRMRPGAIRDDH